MQNSSAVPHHSSPLTQRTLQLKLLRSLDKVVSIVARQLNFALPLDETSDEDGDSLQHGTYMLKWIGSE